LTSGFFSGWIASREVFNPVRSLFRDEDHIEEAYDKYPEDYKTCGDEKYH
jgi:hypothetical protein